MLTMLAVEGYRSLRRLVVPLRQLNVVVGANGTGKSSLYRAIRLLAEAARNGAVSALAREDGLPSTLWAGPEVFGRGTRTPVLDHDGSDLAAALLTISEMGDTDELDEAVGNALPGSRQSITNDAGQCRLFLSQPGLLRPSVSRSFPTGRCDTSGSPHS